MSEPTKLDGGFILREVSEADRGTLNKWIDLDTRHSREVEANYFLGLHPDGTPDPRPSCLCIEDESGRELLFIRLNKVARVRIQFQPAKTKMQRAITAKALMQGMAYLESLLARRDTEEWIFDTTDMELATFAISHLGFVASPDEMKRGIEPPRANGEQGEASEREKEAV